MNKFLVALQFLTRISPKPNLVVDQETFARSMIYFPLIGLIIGGILAGTAWVGTNMLTPLVAGVIILAIEVLVTGGLHLDGFMDTMDGVYSGRARERILEIMKDSRVGAHSVIILGLFFLFKLALLTELPEDLLLKALVFMPIPGRIAQIFCMVVFPYVRVEGLGNLFKDYIGFRELLPGLILALPLSYLLLGFAGLAAYILTMGYVYLQGRRLTAKLEGLTGDIYGALSEQSEVVFLFLIYIQSLASWQKIF